MISFTEALIKGKIAETIFEQMLRNARFKNKSGKSESVFTVLHFGYEHVLPELAKNSELRTREDNITLDAIRTAPDFAVVNNKTKEVSLIEVKYRSEYSQNEVLKIARKMQKSWVSAKLFLATTKGFYFDDIRDIIDNEGKMQKLIHKNIPKEVQEKYLDILVRYENN